jgi:hypothetical protein
VRRRPEGHVVPLPGGVHRHGRSHRAGAEHRGPCHGRTIIG